MLSQNERQSVVKKWPWSWFHGSQCIIPALHNTTTLAALPVTEHEVLKVGMCFSVIHQLLLTFSSWIFLFVFLDRSIHFFILYVPGDHTASTISFLTATHTTQHCVCEETKGTAIHFYSKSTMLVLGSAVKISRLSATEACNIYTLKKQGKVFLNSCHSHDPKYEAFKPMPQGAMCSEFSFGLVVFSFWFMFCTLLRSWNSLLRVYIDIHVYDYTQ